MDAYILSFSFSLSSHDCFIPPQDKRAKKAVVDSSLVQQESLPHQPSPSVSLKAGGCFDFASLGSGSDMWYNLACSDQCDFEVLRVISEADFSASSVTAQKVKKDCIGALNKMKYQKLLEARSDTEKVVEIATAYQQVTISELESQIAGTKSEALKVIFEDALRQKLAMAA